jgi:hypothetical protein
VEAEQKKIERIMSRRSARNYLLCSALLVVLLTLAACSPQVPASTQVAPTPVKATVEIQPSITPPTLPKGNKADSPAVRSYRALLMLETSADLMLAVIEKIQNGEISQGDSSAISPYTKSFSVAVEALSQASPPAELEDPWNQVMMAAQQYNQAYTMLNLGMPISSKNLGYLIDTRKLLSIDQQMVEVYLKQSGLGPDFFVAQQQAVDQHLQQLYGDQPVPALQP